MSFMRENYKMIKLTLLSAIFYHVIMTSHALPTEISRLPVETSFDEEQLNKLPVYYYKPLKSILKSIFEVQRIHNLLKEYNFIARATTTTPATTTTTTTTTMAPQYAKRAGGLSINLELTSLANLLALRENKRRRAEISAVRSRLISIGKRSVPKIMSKFLTKSSARIQKRDVEQTTYDQDQLGVTYGDVVSFLTKLFPQISEEKIQYLVIENLSNYTKNTGSNIISTGSDSLESSSKDFMDTLKEKLAEK